MKRSSIAVLLLAGLLPLACGTTASTSDPKAVLPSSVTTTTITFTSTVTGAPVPGANVVVAGTAYTTGADGLITLTPIPVVGATIDATAAGFFDRATTYRSDTSMTLWEIPTGVDPSWVRQLAYNREGIPETLWRPSGTVIYLQLTGDLANDPEVRNAHLQAAAMATALTGSRVSVQLGGPTSGAGVFTLLINASSSGSTTTFLNQTKGAILGGRVEYPSLAAARTTRVVAHEIGHMLGFGHSPTGLMCATYCGVDNFSPLDQAVFVSMWQRVPGTTPPDNDRIATSSSFSGEAVLHCDLK